MPLRKMRKTPLSKKTWCQNNLVVYVADVRKLFEAVYYNCYSNNLKLTSLVFPSSSQDAHKNCLNNLGAKIMM